MKRTITLLAITLTMGILLSVGVSRSSRYSLVPQAHANGGGCSLATVRGSYGFYRVGTTPNGPLGAVGVLTFDGRGGSSARQTIRVDGDETLDLFTDPAIDAGYSINSDCTGELLNPDGSAFGHAVVVGGGNEIYLMSLSDHNTVTGVAKRIVPLQQ